MSMTNKILFFLSCLTSAQSTWAATTLGREVSVRLFWNNKNFPLKMRVFTASSDKVLDVKETLVTKLSEPLPRWILRETTNQTLRGELGQALPFVMLIENPTDKPYYFFAAPHTYEPAESSFGVELSCLCVGSIFTLPPKSRWLRVGVAKILKSSNASVLNITHSLIGIPEDKLEKKGLNKLLYK